MKRPPKKLRFNKYGPKRGEVVYCEVDEGEEVATLRQRCADEAPPPGTQPRSAGALRFDALPISTKTLHGLKVAKIEIATEIQAAAIPHALAGRDILGAAKTGSGKTLAFVIPILERLYCERWGVDDGLAALIITPTRELALQIFEVLRQVGKLHQLSAGLVTGGRKEFEGEQERIIKMNILVATPGRLLQHFEQTAGFEASQLMVLVLDEADRILDMGFKAQLDGILGYLPPRQTLLFSATQTKSVKDLARLSLNRPEYVAVHAEDKEVTPKQLVQNYIVVRLPDKLNVLYSFLKTHLKNKMIVFFATCSQVRFAFDLFRGMQPGIPLVALHGKIKQERRTLIYMDFIRRKSACMFATDIASRGLDFPDIDWVDQVDAPEDTNMYIHRVGRTARYNANGRALLLLLPSEEAPVSRNLSEAGVPIKRLTVNPNQTVSVGTVAASFLAQHPDCRVLAKKAFVSYIRSLQLTPGQQAGVDLSKLPLDDFAASLGLPFTPEVSAMTGTAEREEVREKKNVNRSLDKLKKQIKAAKEEKRRAREAAARGEAPPPPNANSSSSSADDDDDDGDLFTVKKIHEWASASSSSSSKTAGSRSDDPNDATDVAAVGDAGSKVKKPKALKIKLDGTARATRDAGVQKIVYDDEGNPVEQIKLMERPQGFGSGSRSTDGPGRQLIGVTAQVEERARRVRAALDQGRYADRLREADRIKEKRLQRKMKYLAEKDRKSGEPAVAVLGGRDGDDDDDDDIDDGGGGRGRVVMSDDDDEYDRGRSRHDNDDDDDDNDDNDDERPARRKRARSADLDQDEIRKQERLALKLLRTSK